MMDDEVSTSEILNDFDITDSLKKQSEEESEDSDEGIGVPFFGKKQWHFRNCAQFFVMQRKFICSIKQRRSHQRLFIKM